MMTKFECDILDWYLRFKKGWKYAPGFRNFIDSQESVLAIGLCLFYINP